MALGGSERCAWPMKRTRARTVWGQRVEGGQVNGCASTAQWRALPAASAAAMGTTKCAHARHARPQPIRTAPSASFPLIMSECRLCPGSTGACCLEGWAKSDAE